MSENSNSVPENIEILNMLQLSESLKAINSAVNQACKSGSFNIQEAYLLHVSLTNIEKALKALDLDQKILTKLSEQAKEPKIKTTVFPPDRDGPFSH